ncbi:MAG: competence protein ComA [Rhodothermaceae bacterium]|nr:competence protein ComA [Rhodothermaceae bacterium]MBC12086.1 competence protein ComA [Rhodothermaceae bacterium]
MPKSLSDFPVRETLGDTLGMEIVEGSAERVVATMPVEPRHHQPLGYLHGGATVALAETVASVGAYLAAPEGYTAFGQEINANHLRPMREGLLTATGTPIHVGRTSQVWGVEVRDQAGHMICVSRCTLAVVAIRRESS